MSRSVALAVLLVVGVASTSGCSFGERVLYYPVDRTKDFFDVIGLEAYLGQGFLANGRITKVAQVGLGAFDGDVFRYSQRACGRMEEVRAEFGGPMFYFTAYDRKPVPELCTDGFLARYADQEMTGETHYNLTDPQDRGFYEVGVSVSAFIGVGAHVDLLQTIDLALGLLGLDICADDHHNADHFNVTGPRLEGIGDTPVSTPKA